MIYINLQNEIRNVLFFIYSNNRLLTASLNCPAKEKRTMNILVLRKNSSEKYLILKYEKKLSLFYMNFFYFIVLETVFSLPAQY